MKKAWLFGLVLLLGLMTACGNSETASSDEKNKDDNKTEDTSYTIEHAMGETTLEETPEKVVVLTNEGTEALLAVGVKPVGAVQSWLGDPWYDHIADEMDGVEVVGNEMGPDLEKIATLEPDLIIGNKVRQEAFYDKLNEIAPTVFAETLTGNWQANFELYTKALNKEEEGKEVIAQFNDRIEEVKTNLGEKTDQTISVVRFQADMARIYYKDSFSGVILEQLGFKRPENLEALFDGNEYGNFAMEVTKEQIPEMDADHLFYFTYAPPYDEKSYDGAMKTEEEWTNDPLWEKLSVVEEGNVKRVEDSIWNTAGGVKAANLMIDQLEAYFAE
ncbi:iron-siderophore ABC transporter substrate-binding protein [Bacillus carboniphilus]|uniref:Iron-siderophore ABC transporter substrate-binding protein n=1 Tax=Bacillus carboniphilus TaxID=86663 RepID=A0ABY9JPL6_9BACI|nr:iron-siderophore ABC transporter substrate-binding protein [Bacillus carboniphilus]WLR41349.1 iron-siderophore ABC transporter substrate-binding protein [Bacillus carboniphilus]